MRSILIAILSVLITTPSFAATGFYRGTGASVGEAKIYRGNGTTAEEVRLFRGNGTISELIIGPVSGGDACTGTQLFAAHFENNDDVTAGTPAGCSVGDTTIIRNGTIAYSSTQKSDGSYSAYSTGETSSAVIDSTNIDVSATGTWCGDVYFTRTSDTSIVTMYTNGPKIQIVYIDGANTARTYYGSSYTTGIGATFNNNEFVRICGSWDTTPAAGSQKLASKVGGNSWIEGTNKTLTYVSNPSTYSIASGGGQFWPGYMDNIKLYSDYKHAE